ncbi:hypothetical protein K239x_41860 [Planctomycetes bacterium K23_9]|uniref:Uncharacterized protein n=1 Tax=Stieleria marina TaxID=1930275 RepID=A0A517NYI3_9BACT|nr:hypothetical protein K239x_41860 [Planctomycetes bacterium K23_9]
MFAPKTNCFSFSATMNVSQASDAAKRWLEFVIRDYAGAFNVSRRYKKEASATRLR